MQSIASSIIASSIIDQMTHIYVFVDDYLKNHPAQAAWRRSNNNTPPFTDAEVITLGLLQAAFGCDTLKKTYQLVAANWHKAFPRLCSYSQFLARLHALSALVGQLTQAALGRCNLYGRLYMMDGLPIPVCKSIRHGRVRLLHEDGAHFGRSSIGWYFGRSSIGWYFGRSSIGWYFGRSSIGWYFGFTLHTLIHRSGAILSAVLTPAIWDEHDVALALGLSVDGGVVLADLGYPSQGNELAQTLAEEADMLLIHPADAGAKRTARRTLVSCLRERIETTFSGLWRRFSDRVYSRSCLQSFLAGFVEQPQA